jgi:hypothetical protein
MNLALDRGLSVYARTAPLPLIGVTMPKLIYQAIASLDGYVEDEAGNFDWAAPDGEVHAFVNDLERPIGTHLYGRRMYETMVFWETVSTGTDQPVVIRDFRDLAGGGEGRVLPETSRRYPARGPGSSATSTPMRSAGSRRPPKLTSRSGVQTSPARRSPWAWSTSATCSSGRSWLAAASTRCPTGSAHSSNSSASAGSETASFIFDTASASDQYGHRPENRHLL